MKASSKAGKALVAQLATIEAGDKTEIEGFLTGFGAPVWAHCTEHEAEKFWQFALYWNGVHIQDAVVERAGDNLTIDVLGA
jgi:hypothetical protein